MKVQFILEAIAEKEQITVEQAELIEYLIMTAQQYGMDPNQFAQAIDSQNQIPAMVSEVSRRKALASVLQRATVTDTDGNVIDLETLGGAQDAEAGEAEDLEVEPEGEGSVQEQAAGEVTEHATAEVTEASTQAPGGPGDPTAEPDTRT